jgi:hypothetical protein
VSVLFTLLCLAGPAFIVWMFIGEALAKMSGAAAMSASERGTAPRISEISRPGSSLALASLALAVTRLPLQSEPMQTLCAAFLAFCNPPTNAVSQAAL